MLTNYIIFRVSLILCSDVGDLFILLKEKLPGFSSIKYAASKKDGCLIGIFEIQNSVSPHILYKFLDSSGEIQMWNLYRNHLFYLPVYAKHALSGVSPFITPSFSAQLQRLNYNFFRVSTPSDVVFFSGLLHSDGPAILKTLKENTFLQSYFFAISTLNDISSYFLVIELKTEFLSHRFKHSFFFDETRIFVCLKQAMEFFVAKTLQQTPTKLCLSCDLDSVVILNKLYDTEFAKRVGFLAKK